MLEGLQSMQGTQGIKLCSLCRHRPCNGRLQVYLCLKSCSLTAAASACTTVSQQVASCNAHERWASCPRGSTSRTQHCVAIRLSTSVCLPLCSRLALCLNPYRDCYQYPDVIHKQIVKGHAAASLQSTPDAGSTRLRQICN